MSPEHSDAATTSAPTVPAAPDLAIPGSPPAPAENPGTEMPVTAGNVRIGRAPDNDLVVDDLLVSRYHAQLRQKTDGRLEIKGLGAGSSMMRVRWCVTGQA